MSKSLLGHSRNTNELRERIWPSYRENIRVVYRKMEQNLGIEVRAMLQRALCDELILTIVISQSFNELPKVKQIKHIISHIQNSSSN